jgi:hypothetical protein
MSKTTARLIAFAAFAMIATSVGIFALPRVVEALPGRYLVRLQSHPLTGGVVSLVAEPVPDTLPVSRGERVAATGPVLDIPGLAEQSRDTQLLSAPGVAAAVNPEPAAPQPSPTRETIIITVGGTATPGAEQPVVEGPTPTPSPTPSPTLPPVPRRVMIEDVRYDIVQTFNNCGPANMTIVLNYWGVDTTQQQAADYLKPNEEDRNVSPWQITDYVNEQLNVGVKSTAHASGTPELLKQFIAAGFPVVIEKGYEPGTSEGWYGHYLTVFGYDDDRQEFYSRDTYLGPHDGTPRIDKYDEFMKWWQQFYYTFYVIYPEHRADEVFAIIPDVLEDDVTMWQHAVEIARRELQADEDNVFTWFNLGVALTRLGENATSGNQQYYLEATSAFDHAREIGLPPRTLYYEHRPFMAYFKTGRNDDILELTGSLIDSTPGGKWVEEIHWYRGHALTAVGDLTGAAEAYEKALEVNPNFYYAQWSLDYVKDLIGG